MTQHVHLPSGHSLDSHDTAPATGLVAARAAHGINNLAALLVAAAEHLQVPTDAARVDLARAAVDDACAAALALSAALGLLALQPPHVEAAVRHAPRPLDGQDLERVLDNLRGGVALDAAPACRSLPVLLTAVDRPTLQSLLLCLIHSMRLGLSPQARLHLSWQVCRVVPGEAPAWEFVLASRDTGPLMPRRSDSLFDQALSHVAPLLSRLGASFHSDAGQAVLTLKPSVRGPAEASS